MMISWQVSRECSTLRLNVRMRRLTTTRGSRGTTPAGWLTELSSAPTVRLLASSALIHHDYSAPDKGAEYCDERVCVCVFVCPRSYLRNYTSNLHQIFVRVTAVAVARSSSGGIVMRYTLPVLWMTSCLLISQGCSSSPPS